MKKIDAVIVFKPDHLYITKLAIRKLFEFADIRDIYLVSNDVGLKQIKNISKNIKLLHEDTVVPTMTIESLSKLKIDGFPKRAGWYYQQFLKWGVAFIDDISDQYLIWEADTILLKRLSFIDDNGRTIFTKASEYHAPYFEAYEQLLGEKAQYEFSFIAQHIIVTKSILQEMLNKIEMRFNGDDNWAWKIIKNINVVSNSKIADYETYGHFVKNHYPNRITFREIPWTRQGASLTSMHPNDKDLTFLSKKYYFASFELWDSPKFRIMNILRTFLLHPIRNIFASRSNK